MTPRRRRLGVRLGRARRSRSTNDAAKGGRLDFFGPKKHGKNWKNRKMWRFWLRNMEVSPKIPNSTIVFKEYGGFLQGGGLPIAGWLMESSTSPRKLPSAATWDHWSKVKPLKIACQDLWWGHFWQLTFRWFIRIYEFVNCHNFLHCLETASLWIHYLKVDGLCNSSPMSAPCVCVICKYIYIYTIYTHTHTYYTYSIWSTPCFHILYRIKQSQNLSHVAHISQLMIHSCLW